MEVYVLLGHFEYEISYSKFEYESNELLGVYHTQSDAEFAREEYDRENIPFFEYEIERRVIGGRAKWEY